MHVSSFTIRLMKGVPLFRKSYSLLISVKSNNDLGRIYERSLIAKFRRSLTRMMRIIGFIGNPYSCCFLMYRLNL
jgi:hypothetical protein